MDVREFSIEDLRGVFEIEKLSFKHPYSKRIFESYEGSDLFLVAVERVEVVGYVIGEVRGDEGWIISVAVHPDYRHEGIGTRLMREVMEKMDAAEFYLTVRVGNAGAMDFYSEQGFELVGVVSGYYQNGEDALLMKK